MNIFQCSFHQRLRSWRDLRLSIKDLPIQEKCVRIDEWWQMAPLITHHLHPLDYNNWPDPWTLLSENMYCILTRALGIVYTLKMNGIYNIKLLIATDSQAEEIPIVTVDDAKYVLNYWPGMVLNNCFKDFTVKREISLSFIKLK